MCTKDAPGLEPVTFLTDHYESNGKIYEFGSSHGLPRRDRAGRT